MNQTFFTEPIERPISKVTGFNFTFTDLILGTSVRVCVQLHYSTGYSHRQENKEFIIEGDEYLAWGTDDNYMNELVKSKIITLLTEVEQISPPIV